MLNRHSGIISTECSCGSLVDSILRGGGWISTRKSLYFLEWNMRDAYTYTRAINTWVRHLVPVLATQVPFTRRWGRTTSRYAHYGDYSAFIFIYGRIPHRLTRRESLGIVIRVSVWVGGRISIRLLSDSKETWIISLGTIETGWIRGKYEKIRAGIGTWTRAVRATVERLYRETTNALSHCELLSIIICDAGNTGIYHAPVINMCNELQNFWPILHNHMQLFDSRLHNSSIQLHLLNLSFACWFLSCITSLYQIGTLTNLRIFRLLKRRIC